MKRSRQRVERRVFGFLIAKQVALHFHAHIPAAEESDKAIQEATHAVMPSIKQRWTTKRHQPSGPAFEFFETQCPFALWSAHLHACYKPAEVSIAFLRLHQHRQRPEVIDES